MTTSSGEVKLRVSKRATVDISPRTPPRTYRGRQLSTARISVMGRVLEGDLAGAADPGKAMWSKGASARAWHLVDVE